MLARKQQIHTGLLILAIMLGLIAGMPVYAAPADSASASALGNKDPGKTETAIGDLVADAFRSAMHSDIAFVAASDLKPLDTPIAAGKIKSGDVVALLGYPEDTLTVLAIPGATVKQALERSLSIYPQNNLGFLQVSGLQFSFDPSRASGSRVTSITVGGSPISNDRSYTIAVLNSLANGALGYWKVWSSNNITSRPQIITCATAIDNYFQSNPKLDYSTLNRISSTK